jgi:hypothetical protein
MKTKIVCIVAGAILALSMSTTAAAGAGDGTAKAAAETEPVPAKTASAAKETANSHTPGGQQNKMKHCNESAKKKELKGDERRAFMSACLKG